MSRFLKGTYALPNKGSSPTVDATSPGPDPSDSERIAAELRDRALASISGSMVYVERTALSWDPEQDEDDCDDPAGQ